MREGGQMLATVLHVTSAAVVPDITTKQLANIAARELKALGGKPSFLGYHGFPDVICISVNDEIVHGIPSPRRILYEGDIVGLDFGVTYKGLITDSAVSVVVGQHIKSDLLKLLEVTKLSLDAGIAVVRSGVRVGDISAAVQGAVFEHGKYGIPHDLVGHGIGENLWEEPNVPNYGRAGVGQRLEAGMTIAIEPMVTLGTDKISVESDGWTIVTTDKSWAAHFEHTVLITEHGAEILTQLP
jgi:methionyl aminopeptidase